MVFLKSPGRDGHSALRGVREQIVKKRGHFTRVEFQVAMSKGPLGAWCSFCWSSSGATSESR